MASVFQIFRKIGKGHAENSKISDASERILNPNAPEVKPSFSSNTIENSWGNFKPNRVYLKFSPYYKTVDLNSVPDYSFYIESIHLWLS